MDISLRSLLFVPGDRAEKIEKAWQVGPDCIILDLEDGVAESQKPLARQNIRRTLEAARPLPPVVLVRVNSSPSHRSLDIEAAVHSTVLGIVLPKCDSARDITEVAQELGRLEQQRGVATTSVRLFLLIESARGLLELPALVAASDRVAAVVFGAEDWCLDMGIARTKAGSELEIARWNIAVCARAYGLIAIDTVYTDFRDTEGLLRETETAKRMGFSGKLAIHPEQLDPIHSAFVPSAAEIADAENIVAVFDQAEAQGSGAIAVNGRMVDKPIAERARQILERSRTGR